MRVIPMALDPLEFIVLCLAAFRLTRFFIKDSLMGFGPDSGSRASVRIDRFAYLEDGTGRSWWREYVGDLLTCVWCLGFWLSAIAYFGWLSATVGWSGIESVGWQVHLLTVFGVAGVQGYLNTRMNT